MSIWAEPNEDAYTVDTDAAATGPRVGFLQAFETSYQSQVRGSAMYGIEKAMYDEDAAQIEALRRAGVEDIPRLSDDAFGMFGSGSFSGDYLDAARFYEDGGEPEIQQRLDAYDTKIDTLREKYPELQLKSSREMWDGVRNTARMYEQRLEKERHTWGGTFGGLAGGAIGSLNVESDPWNFATIPLGGAGKSIIGRIAGQGAAQGFVEAINQITGVQEQRRLIGLSNGFADGLTRVGGAALGGAGLQALGEAGVGVAKRFFRNAKMDPAPDPSPAIPPSSRRAGEADALARQVPEGAIPADPEVGAARLAQRPETYMDYLQDVSPWSVSRAGKARSVLDMDNVKRQLDDWAGPSPAFVSPKTDAMPALPRTDFTRQEPNIFERVANTPNYDQLARQVDPDTFRVYDKLADENNTLRAWLRELGETRPEGVSSKFAEVNARVDELSEKMVRAGGMKRKTYMKEIAALKTERDAVRQSEFGGDTPDMARVRAQLIKNDEKMRDMSPVVSRAYARARGRWDNTEADRKSVREMIAAGRKNIGDVEDKPDPLAALPASLFDRAPILRQRSKVEASLPADADAATVASRILDANAKENEVILEAFKTSVAKAIKDVEDAKAKPVEPKEGELPPDQFLLPGYKEPISLDERIVIPNEDGSGQREVSLRQMFMEQAEGEADLKAVASCSIK